MRKALTVFVSFFLLLSVQGLEAQKLIKNRLITGVCYAGDKVNKIYIPPPDEFFIKCGVKGGASLTIYYTGFPPEAIVAMEYAASILESLLPDDARITVLATWQNITSQGVLANSSTTGYVPGWEIDALLPYAFYPAALAEKITGKSLNFDLEGDIKLVVNSSVNWYMRTDGKTPVLSYDLVTVVIHELIHGLGFFDSMNVDGSVGYYGAGSVPLIYDTFVEDIQGRKLTDTAFFDNPSASLKNELTGGQLWFNGPLLSEYTSGNRARLYVPSTFDPGSSISHLDETTTLKENQLMTPFINRGEAIHDPGIYSMAILGDLGWINTRISHEVPRDTEDHLTGINIRAEIISDTTYFRDKVGLVWSTDAFETSDTLIMISPSDDDNFSATIPVNKYETELEYYIYVEDDFRRIYRSPSFIKEFRHSVYIGTDTVKPVITHTPADYYFELVDTISFKAEAKDNLGIDTVYVEYKVNQNTVNYLGLKNEGKDSYGNSLNIKELSITNTDSIGYRIIALDKAASANRKTIPSSGFYYINFERINKPVDSYSTDFTDAEDDFFNNGFVIAAPEDFSNYGLHTKHPYESPEETGDSIGYTAVLRTPFRFDPGGMLISYNEIVLVEAGEAGSVFGSQEFYDYVIVEGSVNYGKSWFPLTDGYDCRYQKAWENAYNSSITGNNSLFKGDESMLVRHTIFLKPSARIRAGDTLVIRFRLFSDPYANGWGWVIEDLHAGPLIDNVENIVYDEPVIYPNPGNGIITIRKNEEMVIEPSVFSLYNSTGKCLIKKSTAGGETINIDISSYPEGFYFILLQNDRQNFVFKYILIR